MLFSKKESPVVTLVKSLAVPTLTIIGSGCAAYYGARKGVADTVEECAAAVQKVVPVFEGLINKAEEAANAAPAAPAPAASDDELAKYKEAIKQLMAKNAELEKAAAQSAEAPKAEAKSAEAPEAPKKEKKEKKAEVNAEAEAK